MLWSWLFNGLRLASGVLLLPLLLKVLPERDLGMHYIFLNLAAVIPMMDFGFALSVERAIAYALGGASTLAAQGLGERGPQAGANEAVIRDVVFSARRLYRWLAAGAWVVLAVGGSVLVADRAHETSRPEWTWVAWGVFLVTSSLEIYTGYWVATLRGLNSVTLAARWLSVAYALKLLLAIVLLTAGAGLVAVPAAGLVAGLFLRAGAGRAVGRRVAGPRDGGTEGGASAGRILRALWPNSWRLGVQMAALFVSNYTYTFLCSRTFGLEVMYQYGLSVQVMTIALGMAAVWTSVKWPMVAQLRMRGDRAGMRRLLWSRVWLQVLTYLALATVAVTQGQAILALLQTSKQLLPTPWLILLAIDGLGQLNFTLWTTVISTENRIPAVWALVTTHALGWVTASVLVLGLGYGVEALIWTPLLLGSLFNYWWWGREGTRVLGTTFVRFLFGPFLASDARST